MAIIAIAGKKQHGKDTVADIIQWLAGGHDGEGDFEEYRKWVKENPIETLTAPHCWNGNWQKKQFAGKLKQIVALLIGCDIKQLEDEEFKNTPLGEEWNYNTVAPNHGFGSVLVDWNRSWKPQVHTPRTLLQLIGTQGLRNIIHPNVHINALFSNYEEDVPCACAKFERETGGMMNCMVCEEKIGSKWIITDVRFPNEVKAIQEKGGTVIKVFNPRVKSIDQHESETALDNYEFHTTLINSSTINDLIDQVRVFLQVKQII